MKLGMCISQKTSNNQLTLSDVERLVTTCGYQAGEIQPWTIYICAL